LFLTTKSFHLDKRRSGRLDLMRKGISMARQTISPKTSRQILMDPSGGRIERRLDV
jgi:hypothetical protein